METNEQIHEGACFCGQVKIRVTGAPTAAGYCHCHSCRKWHGAPVNAWALWPDNAFEIIRGEDLVHLFNKQGEEGPSARLTCRNCGAAVANRKPQISMTAVYAMTLAESDFSFQPALHLYYDERVLDMNDGLPKFADSPGAYGGSGELVEEPAATGLRD